MISSSRGDMTLSTIITLILLLVGLFVAYLFIRDNVQPLLESKLGSLFANAKF